MTNTTLTLLSTEAIKHYTAAGFWRDETIYGLAASHAQRAPASFAVRDRFRRVTYRALIAAADALAADLAGRGLRAGQRVAVWLPSRIECAVALLACSRNGYVCCLSLHRDHTVGEIFALLQRTRAAALIAQTGYGADADRHDIFVQAHELELLRHVYRLEPLAGDGPVLVPGTKTGCGFGRRRKERPRPDRLSRLHLRHHRRSEGRDAQRQHAAWRSRARIARDWSIDDESVVYTLSPLSHNLGVGAMILSLVAGGEFVVHDPAARRKPCSTASSRPGATFVVGVPAHAIDLLNEMQRRNMPQARRG